MATDHVEVSIDQDWHIEAEGLDALGNLPDLLLAVQPRVRRIGFKLFDRSVNDFKRLGAPYWMASRSPALHRSGARRRCIEIISDCRRHWDPLSMRWRVASNGAGNNPTG